VNHKKKPDAQRDSLPSCVISLDIGSRGSGYSYWIKEEPDCVRIGNVDRGMYVCVIQSETNSCAVYHTYHINFANNKMIMLLRNRVGKRLIGEFDRPKLNKHGNLLRMDKNIYEMNVG
jgi:hypothetical protein